jgi:hypothetical protein
MVKPMVVSEAYRPEYNLKSDAYLGFPLSKYFFPKLGILASMAKPEEWDFKDPSYKDKDNPFPILFNYINFTYDRLKAENKIAITDDESAMCFNTGLQTEFDNDIYAFFIKNTKFPHEAKQKWYFVKFLEPHAKELAVFAPLPEIAEYIENAGDLIFDRKLLPIRVNYQHIIRDNYEWFKPIADNTEQEWCDKLKAAIERTQARVNRNYKIAIPQLYTDKVSNNSKIQLLLPLCLLKDNNRASLALVVEKEGSAYIAKTVLPLDWAYMNSRRIVKPDVEWIICNI